MKLGTLKTLIPFAIALTGATLAWQHQAPQDPPAKTGRDFPIHSMESAPESTREALAWYQQNFKMVPHLAGVMAESPALLHSYWQTQKNLQEMGALSPAEANIIQFAIALENECQYCVGGHTMAGRMFFGSTEEQLVALRTQSKLPEAKFEALRKFALEVNAAQGRVTDAQLAAFLKAGYTRGHALEVVANIAAKVMSNYANQLAQTPVDAAFKPLTEGLPFAEDRPLKRSQ